MLSLWSLLVIYIHFIYFCGQKTIVWASSKRHGSVTDFSWCLGSSRRHFKSSREKDVEVNNWDYGWRQIFTIASATESPAAKGGEDEGCLWGLQNASADVCFCGGCSYPPVFPLHTQSHSSWCSRATSVSDLCNPLTPIFGLNWRTYEGINMTP